MGREFIMVTPAKNEDKFLSRVIESVVTSSLTPKLWIIVDDNSTDNTSDIVKEASEKYGYIKLFSLNEKHERDLTFHYSYVCRKGFNYATQLAQKNRVNWDYIVLLDADTLIEPRYFEGLLNEMEKNPKIGIASGDLNTLKNGKEKNVKVFGDIPSGTARVWRKRCFYETGGYSITQSPDSISMVKAKLKGWETVRFREYKAYQLRETSSAEGMWKGYIIRGKSTYYVNYHPLLVIGYGLSYMLQYRFYLVIPYYLGFLESVMKKESKIDDEEIKNYFRHKRLNEIKNILIARITMSNMLKKLGGK